MANLVKPPLLFKQLRAKPHSRAGYAVLCGFVRRNNAVI